MPEDKLETVAEAIEKESDGVDEVFNMQDDVYYNPNALTFSELGDASFKFSELTSGLNALSDIFWTLNYRVSNSEKSDEEKLALVKENRKSMVDIGDRLISEFEKKEKSAFTKLLVRIKSWIPKNKDEKKKKEKEIALKGNKNEFWVWKEDNGTHRWFSIYSNMYRDKELEIITSASHERFQDLVDKGEEPYPELWLWHIPGSRVGQADWLYYDKETGFAMASGYFDKGNEYIAEGLSEIEDLATSHGMPNSSIKREIGDELAIEQHLTREISPLLLWAAANPLTGFEILKEDDMPIPEYKKDFLKQAGMDDSDIAKIEAGLESASKDAKERLDFKEVDESQENADSTEEVTEKEEVTETADTTDKDADDTDEDDKEGVFQKGVLDALKAITDSVENLAERVQTVEDNSEKNAKQIEEDMLKSTFSTPSILAEVIGRNLRIVDSEEARVKGNTKLAKSMPEETDEDEKQSQDIFANVISGIIGK